MLIRYEKKRDSIKFKGICAKLQAQALSEYAKGASYEAPFLSGSPDVTLFITVLVLPLLTENLQYQRVIKDQAVPGEAEAALTRISSLCLTITRFHGLFPDFLTS